MNLLAKRAGWLIASAAILFWGCKEDVGIELPPDVQRTEVKYEEFTLPVTNVYFDSLRTDSRGIGVIGNYTDPTYGGLSAQFFSEVYYKDGDTRIVEVEVDRGDYSEYIIDIEFESVELVLSVLHATGSASSFEQPLEVSFLQDSIFSEGVYFRDSEIAKGDLLGTTSIVINDIETINADEDEDEDGTVDTHLISISLPDDFGTDLMNQFAQDSTSITVPGITVEPTGQAGLLSFNLNTNETELLVNLRGKLLDTLGQVKKDTVFEGLSFALNNGNANYFTKIERDLSGSLFSGATDGNKISPSGDFVYFNNLMGIYPLIDLQPVIDFFQSEPSALFNQVTLEIPLENPDDFTAPNNYTQLFFPSGNESEVSVNWPNQLSFPDVLNTVMQTDVKYLTFSSSTPSSIALTRTTINDDETVTGFLSSAVVFWQNLYDNTQDDIEGIDKDDRPLIRSYMTGINSIVLVPGQTIVLGRNAIGKESIKLKVFYTQLRQ